MENEAIKIMKKNINGHRMSSDALLSSLIGHFQASIYGVSTLQRAQFREQPKWQTPLYILNPNGEADNN